MIYNLSINGVESKALGCVLLMFHYMYLFCVLDVYNHVCLYHNVCGVPKTIYKN